MAKYRAKIGWDGGAKTYFRGDGHINPVIIEAASEAEALSVFREMLDADAEANVDRYEGDVESVHIEAIPDKLWEAYTTVAGRVDIPEALLGAWRQMTVPDWIGITDIDPDGFTGTEQQKARVFELLAVAY